MAKRSPILGYNHNVRYRGLVFHVQTEDSGLLNPHLFTHLFHEGVIVSTRKLVYDAGSNEEAIKALMQAQHKAVMKDLRKGSFDDKIDQYLGHMPGLEPRGGAAKPADRSKTDADASGATPLEITNENLSEPIELPIKKPVDGAPTKARTESGDRTIPIDAPPPPQTFDAPTDIQPPPRTKTAQKVSRSQAEIGRAPTQLAAKAPAEARESAPVIEINVDDEDELGRNRVPRDTAVELAEDAARTSRTTTPSRPPSHGAATLPAMKPPSRPIAPPVVSRPATQDRKRPDSDVIEVYSPAPPSVEPPPGERAERPGQYSMSRKEGAAPIREKTGRIEKINPANNTPAQPPRTARSGTGNGPVATERGSDRIPRVGTAQPQGRPNPPPVPPTRPATPAAAPRGPQTQARIPATAPIQNRTPSPANPPAGSGVVMTRPAVIVGAPPKPPQQAPRVRKAREDEGRGFGQGLISEKSLDEVILAYLSEDAEDK